MGYTSDLDAVADWEAGRLNRLIEQCGLKEISFQEGETIDSMEDFCRILCYFAIHGLGGEIALTSQEVVEEMKKHFQEKVRMYKECISEIVKNEKSLIAKGVSENIIKRFEEDDLNSSGETVTEDSSEITDVQEGDTYGDQK